MCEALEHRGYQVTYLPVSGTGLVNLSELRAAITDETILISIMHANNETGTIQPLEEIAEIVSERRTQGHKHLHLHTDGVQSVGKIPVDVKQLGVDLLSLSGHKIHAPKGVGALFIKKGTRLEKLFYGGHHERDKRPGTENVPGIVGLGKACELVRLNFDERSSHTCKLRDEFEQRLLKEIADVSINGDVDRRVPNISNLSFAGLDGESLLIALDLKGIAVSTGSACASGSLEPSHVLTALELSRERVRGSLRISLSAYTTSEEIDYAIAALQEITGRLRRMLPDDKREASSVSEVA
jgi:cysteine desulfurase